MTERSDATAATAPIPTRIVLVEDQHELLARLCSVLDATDDLQVIGTADTLAAGLALLERSPPDMLLTDIGLPDGSGLELIRTCHRRWPSIDIMVITMFGDETTVIDAIRSGATGYLLKDGSGDDIVHWVRTLRRGGSPISPSIARHLLRQLGGSVATLPDSAAAALAPNGAATTRTDAPVGLTLKETDVLRLLAKGFSYAEIASSLEVTVHTVSTHIKSLYRKLAVRSRGEAVFEAVQLGLIQVDRWNG
ncbi:MAG: response regulator [Lautropia sp.]